MSEGWKRLDLEGGGVQAANLKLARLLKRRARAYALLAAFPLGLHRGYLDDRRGAWGYRALALAALACLALGWPWGGAAAGLALAGWAAWDVRWIDDRVAALNKDLRRQVYLAQAPGPPRGFRGRYTDDAEGGALSGPAPGARAPSFAEQEKLLRELARRKAAPPPET